MSRRLEHLFNATAVEARSPGGTNMEAGFLRERLLLFARTWGIILFGYHVLSNILFHLAAVTASEWLMGPNNVALTLSIGLELAVWIGLRWCYPSERALRRIDAWGTFALCLFAAIGSVLEPQLYRTTVLALIFTLVARAVLVPSDAVRTFRIGVSGTLPAIGAGWLIAVRGQMPVPYSIGVEATCIVLWCLAGVAMSTGASKVIFGLRREIQTARRLGQYTLEDRIGAGGMGEVFRARHAMLRRPTAVKILRPETAGEDAIDRFEQEVQLTSRLTHPNTVAIYDFGRTPDGIFFYAMEYLPGIDLRTLVARFGALPPGRAVRILCQVCGSLGEAHSVGLIHRDIKAANVILCERGGIPDVAKVVDFGLVKDTEHLRREDVNIIAGTPPYLSPEAILSPASVDSRSDIYAVGVLGYFLLTGTHPFEGTFEQICASHLQVLPPNPSTRTGRALPDDLVAAVLSCLEKDRGKRPPTAADLAARLESCGCAREWTDREARAWWRTLEESRNLPSPVPTRWEEETRVGPATRNGSTVELGSGASPQREAVMPSHEGSPMVARPPDRGSPPTITAISSVPSSSYAPAESSA